MVNWIILYLECIYIYWILLKFCIIQMASDRDLGTMWSLYKVTCRLSYDDLEVHLLLLFKLKVAQNAQYGC